MNVPATFEVRSLLALPVPELIGGGRGVATSQKIGSVPGYARALYPPPTKNPMPTVHAIYLCALVFPRF